MPPSRPMPKAPLTSGIRSVTLTLFVYAHIVLDKARSGQRGGRLGKASQGLI